MIPDKLPDEYIEDYGAATILNYRKTRNQLRKAYEAADADDRKIISGMISDCEYVMEWLETGRRPGNKRGIERRAVYQRLKLVDPIRMQSFRQPATGGSPSNLSEYQRFQIEDALSRLSPRERECYTMAYGDCLSFSRIGELLNLKKSTVQSYVETAQYKISEDLENSLFLI